MDLDGYWLRRMLRCRPERQDLTCLASWPVSILLGLNPKADDAPPTGLFLPATGNDAPIWQDKVLPLTGLPGQLLLNIWGPYQTLYPILHSITHYTLTRAGPDLQQNGSTQSRFPNEQVRYTIIFDNTERTVRVFTRVGAVDHFYSATVPLVDDLLETQLGEEINSDIDSITGDGDIRTLLVDHFQSLLHATSRRADQTTSTESRIRNAWTVNSKAPAWVLQKIHHHVYQAHYYLYKYCECEQKP